MTAQLPPQESVNRPSHTVPRPVCSGAVDFSSLRPESLRLSRRELGWNLLNFERREVGPSCLHLAEGATEHLIFVSLGRGSLERESTEGNVRQELAPGFVAVLPSGHPVHWSWSSRLSFCLLAPQPDFLQEVARESLALDVDKVTLAFAERDQDPAIGTIAAALARECVRGDAGSRV